MMKLIATVALALSAASAGDAQARREYAADKETVLSAVGKVCFLSGGQITRQDAFQLACQTKFQGGRAALMALANNAMPMMSTEYSLVANGSSTIVQIAEYVETQSARGALQRNLQSGKRAEEDMQIRLGAISSELEKNPRTATK